jgi:hypothetical protein
MGDDGSRTWETTSDGKTRGSDGSECIYGANGQLDHEGSFNFEPDNLTFSHICQDVVPYCDWGD